MRNIRKLTRENFCWLVAMALISSGFGVGSVVVATREQDVVPKAIEYAIGAFFLLLGTGLFTLAEIARNHVAPQPLVFTLNASLSSHRASYGSTSNLDAASPSNQI